jgi:hypothetical protein
MIIGTQIDMTGARTIKIYSIKKLEIKDMAEDAGLGF